MRITFSHLSIPTIISSSKLPNCNCLTQLISNTLNTLTQSLHKLKTLCHISKTKNITLILHFDLNKTLIATDSASGQNLEAVLNELLAEKYQGCWQPGMTAPLSYQDYVAHILHPGDLRNPEIKKARRNLTGQFISFLRTNQHPLHKRVEQEYFFLLEKAKKHFVFPSFIKMLEKLKKHQIKFNIILRTFGQDLDSVISHLNCKLPILQKGYFRAGQLHLSHINRPHLVHKVNDLYTTFLHNQHMAIRDNWEEWHKNGEQESFGKKFPVDTTSRKILSIFFDDIVDENPVAARNAIAPIDAKKCTPIPVFKMLQNRHIFRVNTLEALSDDDYYINLLNSALAFHSKPVLEG